MSKNKAKYMAKPFLATVDSNSSTTASQPNFILIETKANLRIFGDIIPIYNGAKDITTTIISSTSSLSSLVFQSRVFLVCLLSLFFEVVNNAFYQAYLFVSSSANIVSKLPIIAQATYQEIIQAINTLKTPRNRDIWWLSTKISIREALIKLSDALTGISYLLQKTYLTGILLVIVGILAFSQQPYSSLNGDKSVLAKSLDENSSAQQTSFHQNSDSGILSVSSYQEPVDWCPQNIISYNLETGDTAESIAEAHGLLPETVTYNNQTEGVNLPNNLQLPCIDGYIYSVEADISSEELERIFNVDKSLIYSENESEFNHEKAKFLKGVKLVIPTQDFTSITESMKAEEDRIKNLKIAEEEAERKRQEVTRSNADTYKGLTSGQRNSLGFIWPTTGAISRCVVGSHIACDIANRNSPPVFAPQKGRVVKAVRQGDGYGNHVTIDHGGGVVTLYAHLSEIYVVPGQQIMQGEALGRMGSTGYSTGTHLHFEVRVNGVRQNPLNYLP